MNINLPMLIALNKSREEKKKQSKHFSIYILINDLKDILSMGISGLQNMVFVGGIERQSLI